MELSDWVLDDTNKELVKTDLPNNISKNIFVGSNHFNGSKKYE